MKENYFVDRRFSKSECELLFALRTRTVPGIKANFSSQYENNLVCELCSAHPDSQECLLSCDTLSKHVQTPDNIEYEDLYRSVDKQHKIVKVFKQLLRVREILQGDHSSMNNSHQVKFGCVAVNIRRSEKLKITFLILLQVKFHLYVVIRTAGLKNYFLVI